MLASTHESPSSKLKPTVPKQILPLRNTASATNPANQYIIVNPSRASNPHCEVFDERRCENLSGTRMRALRARMDHEGAKMRKFTSDGED
jgi:hypothetical protein